MVRKIVITAIFFMGLPLHAHKMGTVLVGPIHKARSISQHVTSFMNCFRDDMKISIIPSSWSDYKDYQNDVLSRIISPEKFNADKYQALIFVDSFFAFPKNDFLRRPFSGLRMAYAWTDYTVLNRDRVNILNNYFDVVCVPDKCLVEVFEWSGVKIPIFVLPISLELEPFLAVERKVIKKTPFVFGCNAVFEGRKNYELLIAAFAEVFGNNPDVKLRIHGRFGSASSAIKSLLKKLNLKNIKLTDSMISRKECVDFYKSLDCYVLVSKAEGFSITPREALATGIPCILSNNTAHKTICETGFVYAVPSAKTTFKQLQFNCKLSDVCQALREVYENYNKYFLLAQSGREWTKQYLVENLKTLYVNAVMPKVVRFGVMDSLSDEEVVTKSKNLLKKYELIQHHTQHQ